ncbi:heterodisulfide reductase subunit B [Desulfovibrio desulfuricans]|uniref:Heterodisulfide reductase subunit B n=1 Tax=Desulfovibrio desulfuricans TaxID=876 RepID=A0A4P7UPL0_DESDE|nr:8-methylmenaquinol:fumarate reductase membrane anchor subunit [Desulfovibrio desulfuricans]QCC86884.1 heterodisulfide reductase subunit B [Desulfovibrio desulfuricans]
MQTEFAFFPGCVLTQAAKESRMALEAVAPKLGITLKEIPGWSCCGASQAQDVDPVATLVANARNLALAEKMGLPVLTSCSTCLLMLRRAKAELDGGKKDRINTFLAKGNMSYAGTSEVTSLLWVLAQNAQMLKSRVVRPLAGLKVAAFYGCHSLRPEHALGFESAVNPSSFETVVAALGAQTVPFTKRLDCCGFHAVYPAEKSVMRMTGQIVDSAAASGATCLVTPCPLCQMQLDIYQEAAQDISRSKARMPVLHLSQLVGLALGVPAKALGLDYNVVDATKVA